MKSQIPSLLLTLLQILKTLKIDENLSKMVLPNIENKLTPFIISAEDKFERENRYYLKSDCSSSVIENLSFNKITQNLCSKKIEFEYDMVNSFLQEIKVRLNTRHQINNLYIDYKLTYNNQKLKEIVIKKRQEIKTVYEIPIIAKEDKFEFIPGKKVNFNIFVLEVDKEYYKFSNSFHYEIVFSIKNHPDWLAYDINQRKVHFFGTIPKEHKENFNFAFYVLDRETKLSSPLNTFWFSVIKPVVVKKRESKYFIAVFGIVVLFFLFLFIFFVKMKDFLKFKEYEKRVEERNLEICKVIEKKKLLNGKFLRKKKSLDTERDLDSYEMEFKLNEKNLNSFNTNANSFREGVLKEKKFEFFDFRVFSKNSKN